MKARYKPGPTRLMLTLLVAAVSAVTAMAGAPAWAQQAAPADPQAAQAAQAAPSALPMQRMDPYLPPSKRKPSPTPGAAGEDLQLQALARLHQKFVDADIDANGSLTPDEARRGGMGFVAAHFAEIDKDGSGEVSFEDLRKYLALRRQQALEKAARSPSSK